MIGRYAHDKPDLKTVGEHRMLQNKTREILQYRYEDADAHNVIQHSW